jgi:hypothetical protein
VLLCWAGELPHKHRLSNNSILFCKVNFMNFLFTDANNFNKLKVVTFLPGSLLQQGISQLILSPDILMILGWCYKNDFNFSL